MNNQQLIDDMLESVQNRENDFAVISEDGVLRLPILRPSGVHAGYDELPEGVNYRGIALEINDHGNVTVWKCFKNGNKREIASRV